MQVPQQGQQPFCYWVWTVLTPRFQALLVRFPLRSDPCCARSLSVVCERQDFYACSLGTGLCGCCLCGRRS